MAVNKNRHGQHAGVDESLEVHVRRQAVTGQRRQPGAEDEQEKERLYEGSDSPQTVAPETDQLPLPNDRRRPHVVAQAVLGQGHPDLGDQLRLCFDALWALR